MCISAVVQIEGLEGNIMLDLCEINGFALPSSKESEPCKAMAKQLFGYAAKFTSSSTPSGMGLSPIELSRLKMINSAVVQSVLLFFECGKEGAWIKGNAFCLILLPRLNRSGI